MKKQAGVAILISNKNDFKPIVINKDKEGHFILIKGKIFQDELSILNIYAQNARAATFIKETLVKLKAHIALHPIRVGEFNTALSSMDRSLETETKQRHSETNRNYETNGFNISTEHFILKQKDIPSSQHLMVPFPKLTI